MLEGRGARRPFIAFGFGFCLLRGIGAAVRGEQLVPDRFDRLPLLRLVDQAQHVGNVKQVSAGIFGVQILEPRMRRLVA